MRTRSFVVTMCGVLGLFACTGTSEGNGDAKIPDGAVAGSRAITEPPGANCPNGGERIDLGFDLNGDGELTATEDPSTNEVLDTVYACNGADGNDGSNVTATAEPDGSNCANGGFRIDQDGTTLGYICDGEDGVSGSNGSNVTATAELAGSNCANGGFRIDQDSVTLGYICNGQDGGGGASTANIYVDNQDVGCSDDAPGTQGTPNCNIQAALAYVSFGGTIHVAAGTYAPISPYTNATLLGGYESAGWTRDPAANLTIIAPAASEPRYAVDVPSHITITIDGFTLSGANGSDNTFGPLRNSGTADVLNCILDAGDYTGTGSRSALSNSGTLFAVGNVIDGGTAPTTGADTRALFINGGTLVFVNNVVDAGSASQLVYALWQDDAPATYIHNTMLGGSSAGYISSVYNNVLFTVHNRTNTGSDVGIYMINNILTSPTGSNAAISVLQHTSVGAIHYINNLLSTSGAATLAQRANSLTPNAENNIANINGCSGNFIAGCGGDTSANVDGDPDFNGDLTLQSTSDAIDIGLSDVSAWYTAVGAELTSDAAGATRDGSPDAGAYEYLE